MRSRLLSLADCSSLITDPIVESLPLEEITHNVEQDLQNLCMQCKQTVCASSVAMGDTVCLNLESQLPKFHRKGLYLCVGAGLFDAALEATLPGKTVGSVYSADLQGHTVTVAVEQCLRTQIPEPSDALIAGLGQEGITTLEQYRLQTAEQYKAMYREYYLQYLANEHMEQWFDASSWNIDPQERELFVQAAKQQYERECAAHNSVMLENYPGELDEILQNDALRYLQALLAGCALSGMNPDDLQPDLEHMYARKAAMERIWEHVVEILSPHFALNWEDDC